MPESSTALLDPPHGGPPEHAPAVEEKARPEVGPASTPPDTARSEPRPPAIRSAATDPRCLHRRPDHEVSASPTAPTAPRGTVVALVCAVVVALLGTATAVARTSSQPVVLPAGVLAPIPPDQPPPGQPSPAPPVQRVLPSGKGMWMWEVEQSEGGDVPAMIARAQATGLTHIYVRTGSGWDGFYAAGFLDHILPAAHAAGIRIYGWDFPHLAAWEEDVARVAATIAYHTPDGHSLDGFAVDIETESEGTHINKEVALAFGQGVRNAAGPDYPLIAVVPRPSPQRVHFPYAETQEAFDAIGPMVYWLNREPASDVAGAMQWLAQFGKPIIPVGQAYDGSPEGGRPGVPPREELLRFMEVADQYGAPAVSFWSWQAADQQAWDAIRDAPQFTG